MREPNLPGEVTLFRFVLLFSPRDGQNQRSFATERSRTWFEARAAVQRRYPDADVMRAPDT